MLARSPGPLTTTYDLAMLDLDGVVYVGDHAVPGAAEHLGVARAAGQRVAFITNNAARPPGVVAAHLTELGVVAAPEDVVTSAQAAASLLHARFGPGARILCLGSDGLREALLEAGLDPVDPAAVGDDTASAGGADDGAVAVASGYAPEIRWREIMRAAVRIRAGLPWVACNTDRTIPTSFGVAPGHGVLVETIARFAGVAPVVAGKPQRPLLDETVRRVGGRRPLMVGDRLDTDIEGAHAAGVDSLLVLTGVTGLPELVAARPEERPTYLSVDLGGLAAEHAAVVPGDGESVVAGGWRARVVEGRLVVDGAGGIEDWWRVAAVASWVHLDRAGSVADITAVRIPGLAPLDR